MAFQGWDVLVEKLIILIIMLAATLITYVFIGLAYGHSLGKNSASVAVGIAAITLVCGLANVGMAWKDPKKID